jgi:hypothetical protein
MRYCGHHVSDMVYESPDKDGFSKIGRRTSAEIPPKTRYKQKQNEIHYENSTHFIRLTLSKVETPPLAVLHNTSENTESPPHLRFRIKSGILHNTTRRDAVLWSSCVGYGDKDGFSKIGP